MTDKTEPPGSGDSSKDECEGGCVIYTKPPCASRRGCICGGEWWKHGCKHSLPLKGSASSSPDEKCETCGHYRANHGPGACLACPSNKSHHPFVPADAETAGEPESRYCGEGGVCRDPLKRCGLKCRRSEPEAPTAAQDAVMDELTRLRQEMEATEPEAPECKSPQGCDKVVPCNPGCAVSAHALHAAMAPLPEPEALVCTHDHWDSAFQRCLDCGFEPESPGSPPRRPPYAVAYATEDGTQYEVALPGDATIRAEGGALIVTHASAVQALTMARPMEGA